MTKKTEQPKVSRRKKVKKEFWEQSGNKWFGRIGPLRVVVCEPFEDSDKEFISYAWFTSDKEMHVGTNVEEAKAEAVRLAQSLFDEAKAVFDSLPEPAEDDKIKPSPVQNSSDNS